MNQPKEKLKIESFFDQLLKNFRPVKARPQCVKAAAGQIIFTAILSREGYRQLWKKTPKANRDEILQAVAEVIDGLLIEVLDAPSGSSKRPKPLKAGTVHLDSSGRAPLPQFPAHPELILHQPTAGQIRSFYRPIAPAKRNLAEPVSLSKAAKRVRKGRARLAPKSGQPPANKPRLLSHS